MSGFVMLTSFGRDRQFRAPAALTYGCVPRHRLTMMRVYHACRRPYQRQRVDETVECDSNTTINPS